MDTQITIRIAMILFLVMPTGMAEDTIVSDTVKKEPTFVIQSSRKLIGDKKMAWISAMRNQLPMARRQIGPFGMLQNPSVQVAEKKKAKPKPGAFLNAIKAMKVNAVVAAENKFIIGSREFRTGDVFPVIRGQRQFNIRIVSVRSNYIVFQNVDTGVHVRRNLNALPPGVSRNSSIGALPGVIPASKKDDSPLHLDSPTLPASTTQQN